MIKVFLKHLIYEKCITIIFDGITKAFKQPVRRYEIINVEKITEKGFSKEIYTVKYNGELHTIVSSRPENMKEMLMEGHGLTSDEVDRELNSLIVAEIEHEIRANEIGADNVIEEMVGHPISNDAIVVDDGNGNIEEVDFDNLPQEIREQLEAFSESQGIELPWEIKNNDTFKSE